MDPKRRTRSPLRLLQPFPSLTQLPTSDPFELHETDLFDQTLTLTPDSPVSSSSICPSPRGAFGLSAALLDDPTPAIVALRASAVPILRSSGSVQPTPLLMSAPVNVPVWPGKNHKTHSEWGQEEEVDDGSEEEMVPPHVMVARSHVTTFSVFEGKGRTLKGRDLRRVRNTVLQRTGFLD